MWQHDTPARLPLPFPREAAALVLRLQELLRVVTGLLAPLRGVGSSFSSQLQVCLSCCDKVYGLFLEEPSDIRARGRERLSVLVCSLGDRLVLVPPSPFFPPSFLTADLELQLKWSHRSLIWYWLQRLFNWLSLAQNTCRRDRLR